MDPFSGKFFEAFENPYLITLTTNNHHEIANLLEGRINFSVIINIGADRYKSIPLFIKARKLILLPASPVLFRNSQ